MNVNLLDVEVELVEVEVDDVVLSEVVVVVQLVLVELLVGVVVVTEAKQKFNESSSDYLYKIIEIYLITA